MMQFFKGLSDYLKGHKMMMSEGWLKWLLLPGLIAVFMFGILLYTFYTLISPEAWLPEWLHVYLGTGIRATSSFLLSVIGYWALQPLIMIMLSPLFSHLAEQIEYKMYGIPPNPFKVSQVIVDLGRSLVMVVMIVFVMFGLIISFWILSFIPMLGFLCASICIPCVQMYFAGMGFADPAMERRQLKVMERWTFCSQHRFRILGLGCGFFFLSMIPIIGWFLAPGYALLASSVGVTQLFHENE